MIENKIPKEVLWVLRKLQGNGYRSYIVGGAVRDLVLGRAPKDFDICTNATPNQVKEIFPKVIDTGLKFGTVTLIENNYGIEVTTFRRGVKFVEEDLLARDFAINALLFDGENLIDLVDGLKDIKNRKIRANGDPKERFLEDPLRMMRAIRLACQLDFTIDEETIKSIKSNAVLIERVSAERVRDELTKILLTQKPSQGLKILQSYGMLKIILPELEACYGFEPRNPHHHLDVFNHTMAVVDKIPEELHLRLSALLHDVAKPQTFSLDDYGIGHFYLHNIKGQELSKEILYRLKFDNRTIEIVGTLIREHMNRLQVVKTSSVKKLINRVGKDNIYSLIQLQIADEAGSSPPHNFEPYFKLKREVDRILKEKEPLSVSDLALGGKDLIQLGYKPGPEMGQILQELLTKVLYDPELNTRDKMLEIIEQNYEKTK